MVTRRDFILSGLASVAGITALSSCSFETGVESYETAVKNTWRHSKGEDGEKFAVLRELVRYATLAPSSHNTQCWRFHIEDASISILPDLSRRCPVVDPEDHHLFISLGCSAENLIQAALAKGLMGNVRFDADRGNAQRISLESTRAVASILFQAIPERQTTRAEYDGKPLTMQELKALEKAANGNGVRLILLTKREAMEKVLEYVILGNTTQMNDRAFVEELKMWIRFSAQEAVRTGDGLYSASSGNPSLPAWLGNLLFDLFFTPRNENDKYAKQVRSSAGIAVFVADQASAAHWVEVGRSYQRFALQSAALGIRNSFLNQPVEVPSLRSQFGAFLGIGNHRPDLVVRFGRGPKLPASLRRPIQSLLV